MSRNTNIFATSLSAFGKSSVKGAALIVFAACLAMLVIAATQEPSVTLGWGYVGDDEAIVFNVYHSTNLTTWAPFATLPGRCRGVVISKNIPQEYYRVSASNTVLCLESDY